jgi:hypothetical protein
MKVRVRDNLPSMLTKVRAQRVFCEAKPRRRVLFVGGLVFNYPRSAPTHPRRLLDSKLRIKSWNQRLVAYS